MPSDLGFKEVIPAVGLGNRLENTILGKQRAAQKLLQCPADRVGQVRGARFQVHFEAEDHRIC